ncbi:MAG: hypothetical protein ABWY78_04995, partial [Microvirga sp.]
MNEQAIHDLVRHCHTRIGRIVNDAADLLDENDRLLFIFDVLGIVLAEVANGLTDEPTPPGRRPEPKADNIVLAAMVLAYLTDPEGLLRLDLGNTIKKTKRLVDRVKA